MAIATTLPEKSTVIDLDAARKARAEARAEAGTPTTFVKLEAGYVPIKPEFSLSVVEALRDGEIRLALTGLLEDPADVDALLADDLSGEDVNVIVTFVGNSLGEASAS